MHLKIEVVHLEHSTNRIVLHGTVSEIPVFSHENHGKRFLRLTMVVPRLSGAVDRLPVIAEEFLVPQQLHTGDPITVSGQVRSHNVRTDGARRLLIFVFAANVVCEEAEAVNDISVEGVLCREPVFRRTPLGREICDVMLAVPRAFRRADYLPCILWGRTAREASVLHTRDVISITGRLQSRDYTKQTAQGTQERTAYEISALSAEFFQQEI